MINSNEKIFKFKLIRGLFYYTHMPYSFKCKDVGMNCNFEIKGASTEQEILEQIKAHAKHAHNISEVSADLENKIKKAIKK